MQKLPTLESKPVKVLGRPAKTDAQLIGFGASPMLSSIMWVVVKLVDTLVCGTSAEMRAGSSPVYPPIIRA